MSAGSSTTPDAAGHPTRGTFGSRPTGRFWGVAHRLGRRDGARTRPVVGTTTTRAHRNVIGTHSGSYSVYRALAVAAGALKREHKADLTKPHPRTPSALPAVGDPGKIVSIDPWGAEVARVRGRAGGGLRHPPHAGRDQAHVMLPEVIEALQRAPVADGELLTANGARW